MSQARQISRRTLGWMLFIQKRIAGDSNCASFARKTFESYFDAQGNDGPLLEVINLDRQVALPPADYSVHAPAKTGE